MIIDPDPAVSPETPETVATRSYVAAVIGSAADSAYSAACAGISGAIASGGYVDSSGARVIADAAAASAVSGAIVSGAEFVTTVGGYTLAQTSGGFLISGGGVAFQVSGGAVVASTSRSTISLDDGSIELDCAGSAGISLGGGNPGEVYIHAMDGAYLNGGYAIATEDYIASQGFVKQLVTSLDYEDTSASIAVLSGGTSYVYTQPLTSLGIASITSDCRALFKFTAGSGFNLGLPNGTELVGVSSYDSGARYVVAVGDGMAIVNPVRIVGA